MTLLRQVSFKAKLCRRNQIIIPKPIRDKFQIETTQTLQVTVNILGNWSSYQTFYNKPNKDGYLTIPKLNSELLQQYCRDKNLKGIILEIDLFPVHTTKKESEEE